MSVSTGAVTVISIRGGMDCASRVRRIATCLAESAGMDAHEAREAAVQVAETCKRAAARAERRGTESVLFTLKASSSGVTAEIAGTPCSSP